MKKLYDLVAVIGEYTVNGEAKKRRKNLGAMFENDNGKFIILDASVNLAVFPRKAGSDSVMVSLYEPKDKQTEQTQHEKAKPEQSEDIPF